MSRYLKCLVIFLFASTLPACKYYEIDHLKAYRSPQPTQQSLFDDAQNGLKTVINLRGANPSSTWYQQEKEITDQFGILQIDIGMSADRLPHRSDLIRLLDAFATAPRPLLIHCMAGVDRTGEASAIYEMLYMGKTKEEALAMLSGEFGYFERNKPAKIYFIRDLWQGEQWAREHYDPCSGAYKYYDVNNPECNGAKASPETGQGDT